MSNSKFRSRESDIVSCPLCLKDCNDPRSLPCLHSFCLDCIQKHCEITKKRPGDEVPCPECQTGFQIPQNGVEALKSTSDPSSGACEACSTDEQFESATVLCVDCDQKLCERCSVPHKKMRGGPHEVRQLDAELSTEQTCDEQPLELQGWW